MADLEQALGEAPITDEAEAPPVEQETEATETPAEAEEIPQETPAEPDGDTPTGDTEEGSTPEPDAGKKDATVPLEALLNEREKRQDLQRQLESQVTQEETSVPDVFENQEGFVSHVNDSISQQIARVEAGFNLRLARMQYTDFDEKATAFQTMAADNPLLGQQALASGNAPEFAYKHVTNAEEMAKLNDPDYVEKLVEERVQEKLKAMEEEGLTKAIDEKTAPPSLSGQRSTGGPKREYSPVSLDQALK